MVDLRLGQGPRLALQLSGRDEGLAVSIVESPVGEAEAERIVLQRIDDVLRMVSQPTFHEDVGRGLFRALLPGPLGEIYRAALAQATLAGQPLTLELRFDRNLVRAARYPWELLHDGTRFLLQSGAVNLARYVSFPEPPRPLTPRRPMDILVIASNPADQPPLMSEFAGLQSAFETYIQSDQLDLAYLIPPTWESMMDWLLAGAPSVLHFEGHGAFSRTGMLVFETPDGESDPVDAQTLGAAFYGTDLRLAVLSACESATAGEESLLGSVAPTLVQAGIPAVVAMQQRLPDEEPSASRAGSTRRCWPVRTSRRRWLPGASSSSARRIGTFRRCICARTARRRSARRFCSAGLIPRPRARPPSIFRCGLASGFAARTRLSRARTNCAACSG